MSGQAPAEAIGEPVREDRSPGDVSRSPATDGSGSARRKPWSHTRLTLVSVLACIVVWQLVSMAAGRSSVSQEPLVPSAIDLVRHFDALAYHWRGGLGVEATSQGADTSVQGALLALAHASLATLARLSLGLLIGIVVAVALAMVISWSRVLRGMLLMPAQTARMLPLLAMSPMFGLWFGNSEQGAVVFVAFGTFAIVFVVALTAIGNVPGYYEQYARSLGASRLRTYITVVLPAALPGLRGGILLAVGFGWSMVIAAEFLGQSVGLGKIVNESQEFGRTGTLAVVGFVVVLYAALSAKLVTKGFDWITRWVE